ncbi:MAG: hypothetical protein WAX89_02725 [Alphaproteobacteria bacterium]
MAKTANHPTWLHTVYGIYLALVCLIAGTVLCVSAGGMVNNAITYAVPEMRVSWYDLNPQPDYVNNVKVEKTAEEKAAYRLERIEQAKWEALRELLDGVVYVLIAGLVFGFHWRLFKRERE